MNLITRANNKHDYYAIFSDWLLINRNNKFEYRSIIENKMNIPMKEKYIDDKFKPLYIFGDTGNGNVDIANVDGYVIDLPKNIAEEVIAINQEYMQKLYQLLGPK